MTRLAVIGLLAGMCMNTAPTLGIAATCDKTTEIERPWEVRVTRTTVSAGGDWTNETLDKGTDSDTKKFDTPLIHTPPAVICSGPTPALPTTIDILATTKFSGALGFAGSARAATGTLDQTIAGTNVPIADQTMTDATLQSRGFSVLSTHSFTASVNSSFSVSGTLGVKDIVWDNAGDDAKLRLDFSVVLNPLRDSGFVKYTIPAPIPASLALGLTGVALLGGIGVARRCHTRV